MNNRFSVTNMSEWKIKHSSYELARNILNNVHRLGLDEETHVFGG